VPDDEITGDDVHAEAQPAAGDEPIDLMAALRASIERSQGGRRSRSGSRSASLESMSKHELEERTRRANVPGRSRMSKDGLVRTLRQAA
jgi:DNA end-binding protein Ku